MCSTKNERKYENVFGALKSDKNAYMRTSCPADYMIR